MGDPLVVTGLALVAPTAALALVVLGGAAAALPGPGRAGLVAGGLPLALLPPVVAAAYASARLTGLFGGIARSDGAGSLVAACASLWLVQRAAWGAFAATCLLGLVLALARSGRTAGGDPCSPRRGALLALLPLLGLLVALAATREVAAAIRVTAAVMASDASDPESEKRTEAVLRAEGLPAQGSGSVGATARFIARAAMLGSFGGATAAVILAGLAVSGLILAWRARFGGSFLAVASVLWLVGVSAGVLVSAGMVFQ